MQNGGEGSGEGTARITTNQTRRARSRTFAPGVAAGPTTRFDFGVADAPLLPCLPDGDNTPETTADSAGGAGRTRAYTRIVSDDICVYAIVLIQKHQRLLIEGKQSRSQELRQRPCL
jgi:hypothetical protein